jgi:hypothetical protein
MIPTDLKPPRRSCKPTIWARRSAKSRDAAPASALPPPQNIDKASPLDIVNWLMKRYCAAVEVEDRKGAAADAKRIDQALTPAAALARTAAPYYHRRMKPADRAPGEPRKQEIIVSWTPPEEVLAEARAQWEESAKKRTAA